MKKILFQKLQYYLLSSFLILAFAGCKKGDNGGGNPGSPQYYISFKANGVQEKYTSNAVSELSFVSQSKLYAAVLTGYSDAGVTTKSHIGIFIFDNNAVSAKTYQDPQKATSGDGSKVPSVMINYYDDAGVGYLSMGAMVDENGNLLPGVQNIVADAKTTITKITTSTIEGTFSGTVFGTDLKTQISITEGKFILQRLQ